MNDAAVADEVNLLVSSVKGAMSRAELAFLRDLAAQTSEAIVEIGTAYGKSAIALALGSRSGRNAPVFAIDPHVEFTGPLGGKYGPKDMETAAQNFIKFDVASIVRVVTLPSEQAAIGWTLPIGLLWIDGDHRLAAVRADYEAFGKHVVTGGYIVFDDTHVPGLGPDIVADQALKEGYVEIPAPDKMRAIRRAT
jgi:predicted O-methyltransferase YrrM